MTKPDSRAPIVGEWNRMPRYECPFCGWDTLDEAQMADHLDPLRGRHLALPDAPPDTVDAFTKAERDELVELRTEVADLRQQAIDNQDAAEKAQKSAERAKAQLTKAKESSADGGQEE